MALRFKVGKNLFRFKLPSLKLGVRGSLFLVFAVIALMAIAISGGASLRTSCGGRSGGASPRSSRLQYGSLRVF